jgi:nucleoside-diphosphate-sugar epimerase
MGPRGRGRGREKAPAAICRKVAQAEDGGVVEVWGDGSAVRSYIYVDDLVDGVVRLMQSDLDRPANIGSPDYVRVQQLVDMVIAISKKRLRVQYAATDSTRGQSQEPRAVCDRCLSRRSHIGFDGRRRPRRRWSALLAT